ncbi:EboA domain-containing protein [Cecembia sp.]|uniref:EboA domain-containing protein n=1 Tax=Cecembia sp. TaxID=1898110 RepID=UPI0025B93362|nr:EboA domain-containing protein [Cecembia sp.]
MSASNLSPQVIDYLIDLLSTQAEADSMNWLKNQSGEIKGSAKAMKLYIAFGKASRHFDKVPLQVSEAQTKEAEQHRKGFTPSAWDKLQTARAILILSYPQTDEGLWFKTMNQLFETGDMQELKSLYAALPILPFQDKLLERAIEGLRTNMTLVFDAVSLDNPYPSEYFDERAWNQMLLKAVFMQRPLFLIQNADQRANENLASILIDFAHERWAAGRNVMPELWRYVAPFFNDSRLEDIEKAVDSDDIMEKQGALLACHQSPFPKAKAYLSKFPEIQRDIKAGKITWESIGKTFAETLIKN